MIARKSAERVLFTPTHLDHNERAFTNMIDVLSEAHHRRVGSLIHVLWGDSRQRNREHFRVAIASGLKKVGCSHESNVTSGIAVK